MPDVVANGTRLFYQQSGTGPDVVLVHAVTSNQAVWVFSGLPDAIAAAGFRVTTYDLRGHGASERPISAVSSWRVSGRSVTAWMPRTIACPMVSGRSGLTSIELIS